MKSIEFSITYFVIFYSVPIQSIVDYSETDPFVGTVLGGDPKNEYVEFADLLYKNYSNFNENNGNVTLPQPGINYKSTISYYRTIETSALSHVENFNGNIQKSNRNDVIEFADLLSKNFSDLQQPVIIHELSTTKTGYTYELQQAHINDQLLPQNGNIDHLQHSHINHQILSQSGNVDNIQQPDINHQNGNIVILQQPDVNHQILSQNGNIDHLQHTHINHESLSQNGDIHILQQPVTNHEVLTQEGYNDNLQQPNINHKLFSQNGNINKLQHQAKHHESLTQYGNRHKFHQPVKNHQLLQQNGNINNLQQPVINHEVLRQNGDIHNFQQSEINHEELTQDGNIHNLQQPNMNHELVPQSNNIHKLHYPDLNDKVLRHDDDNDNLQQPDVNQEAVPQNGNIDNLQQPGINHQLLSQGGNIDNIKTPDINNQNEYIDELQEPDINHELVTQNGNIGNLPPPDLNHKSSAKYGNRNKLQHRELSTHSNDNQIEENEHSDIEFFKPDLTDSRRFSKGSKTSISDFAFMVSVHFSNTSQCGGSIIKSDLVITAASCLQLAWNNRFFRNHPEIIYVRVGSDHSDVGGEKIDVLEINFHPLYHFKTLENNLAILRLVRKIKMTDSNMVEKIGFDRSPFPLSENTSIITALGWGATSINNIPHSNDLYFDTLTIHPWQDCQDIYSSEFVTQTNFCAGFATEAGGTCYHDVGGPGIADGKLMGVISFSSSICGNPDSPTVFTKLGFYTDWIEEIMEQPTIMRTTPMSGNNHHIKESVTTPEEYDMPTETTFTETPFKEYVKKPKKVNKHTTSFIDPSYRESDGIPESYDMPTETTFTDTPIIEYVRKSKKLNTQTESSFTVKGDDDHHHHDSYRESDKTPEMYDMPTETTFPETPVIEYVRKPKKFNTHTETSFTATSFRESDKTPEEYDMPTETSFTETPFIESVKKPKTSNRPTELLITDTSLKKSDKTPEEYDMPTETSFTDKPFIESVKKPKTSNRPTELFITDTPLRDSDRMHKTNDKHRETAMTKTLLTEFDSMLENLDINTETTFDETPLMESDSTQTFNIPTEITYTETPSIEPATRSNTLNIHKKTTHSAPLTRTIFREFITKPKKINIQGKTTHIVTPFRDSVTRQKIFKKPKDTTFTETPFIEYEISSNSDKTPDETQKTGYVRKLSINFVESLAGSEEPADEKNDYSTVIAEKPPGRQRTTGKLEQDTKDNVDNRNLSQEETVTVINEPIVDTSEIREQVLKIIKPSIANLIHKSTLSHGSMITETDYSNIKDNDLKISSSSPGIGENGPHSDNSNIRNDVLKIIKPSRPSFGENGPHSDNSNIRDDVLKIIEPSTVHLSHKSSSSHDLAVSEIDANSNTIVTNPDEIKFDSNEISNIKSLLRKDGNTLENTELESLPISQNAKYSIDKIKKVVIDILLNESNQIEQEKTKPVIDVNDKPKSFNNTQPPAHNISYAIDKVKKAVIDILSHKSNENEQEKTKPMIDVNVEHKPTSQNTPYGFDKVKKAIIDILSHKSNQNEQGQTKSMIDINDKHESPSENTQNAIDKAKKAIVDILSHKSNQIEEEKKEAMSDVDDEHKSFEKAKKAIIDMLSPKSNKFEAITTTNSPSSDNSGLIISVDLSRKSSQSSSSSSSENDVKRSKEIVAQHPNLLINSAGTNGNSDSNEDSEFGLTYNNKNALTKRQESYFEHIKPKPPPRSKNTQYAIDKVKKAIVDILMQKSNNFDRAKRKSTINVDKVIYNEIKKLG